jgi:hypothetical protein
MRMKKTYAAPHRGSTGQTLPVLQELRFLCLLSGPDGEFTLGCRFVVCNKLFYLSA